MSVGPITTETTRSIHEFYNLLIYRDGISIPYTMTQHYHWEHWLAHGFTQDDLKLVVSYIHRRIMERKREKESLLPRNLLTNADNFAQDLSVARSESRAPKHDDRASVLMATGRPAHKVKPTRSIGDVLAGEAAFKEFQKLKEIL